MAATSTPAGARAAVGMTARAIGLALCVALFPAAHLHAEATGFDAALALYQGRHFREARQLFETVAALPAQQVDVDFYLGRLALWYDDEPEALARLEAAARAAPNDARVQNALGDAYGLAAEHAFVVLKPHWAMKCCAAYERAIALDPHEVRYHFSLMGFSLMAPGLIGGGLDRARGEARQIAAIDAFSGRVARATIDLSTGNTPGAFGEFDSALIAQPDDWLALYQLGRCAALSGQQLDRGLAALRRCLTLPRPEGLDLPNEAYIHYRMGDILEKRGDLAGAAAERRRAFVLEPALKPAKILLRY